MYNCRIVKDSVAENGVRLTTFEVTYPLIIHAEIMTHRVFSRNVASNRAIPVHKLIESVKHNPFIPERFPKNKAGMQNDEWLTGLKDKLARFGWLAARTSAVWSAKGLMKVGVHKQITNRLLAPFLWTTAVITATDWDNFFDLRVHLAAQPEIYKIAEMMKYEYGDSVPEFLHYGQWHLPYLGKEAKCEAYNLAYQMASEIRDSSTTEENFASAVQKIADELCILISIGRCARVSYLNHGEGNPIQKDIDLAIRLIDSKHMSPTEHVATPTKEDGYVGNFRGWKQHRKFIDGESGQRLC